MPLGSFTFANQAVRRRARAASTCDEYAVLQFSSKLFAVLLRASASELTSLGLVISITPKRSTNRLT